MPLRLPNWSLAALALLVAACLPAMAQDAPERPGLIFTGDFESGGMDAYGDSHEHTVSKTAIVDEPVRAGEHALMVTLDRVAHAEMTRHRTDFWLRGMSQSARQGQDYWYGLSTFMPEDWQPDTQGELFVQWVLGLPATDVGGPSLAIYIYGEGYCLRKRWGPGMETYKNLWRGGVLADRGRWVDWVFHVRWSSGDDGFIEVWRDGEQIVDDTGVNCVAAEFAPYLKFGIYKWPWSSDEGAAASSITRRVMYFDEIRIADSSGNYRSVSPGADGPAPTGNGSMTMGWQRTRLAGDDPDPPEAAETVWEADLADTGDWVLDGVGTVEHLDGGVLKVTTETPTVYWAPPTLEEPVLIEFEARTDDANCRAILFFMADGIGGEDIFSWQRAGDYGDYAYDNEMELYTFGMLREGCGTETNFRRIGTLPEDLAILRTPVAEIPEERREEYRDAVARFQPYSIHDETTDGYRLGEWMRYQALVDGELVRVFADGKLLLEVSYDQPLRRGKLGLRNFGKGSAIMIRDLQVSRPASPAAPE